jgi:hypothetical protein
MRRWKRAKSCGGGKGGCTHFFGRLFYGVRGQAKRDPAFDYTEALGTTEAAKITPRQSGVAPMFPLAAALHIKPPPAAVMAKPLARGCQDFRG